MQGLLSKHLRLTVYSYLDHEETFFKAAILSRFERKSLRQSEIAREGKELVINWQGSQLDDCLLHGDKLRTFVQRLSTAILLTDTI